jgi:hypothetical protein
MPRDLTAPPAPISDYLDLLDGGAKEFQRRPHFDGVANHADRYTFSFPLDNLRGDNRVTMELIRVRGGTHRLVIWRMVPVIWTAPRAGIQRFYFPRFRKCAAHVYEGLHIGSGVFVSPDLFPTLATLNDEDLTVTYAEGPDLASPGAGGLVVSRLADESGPAMDYSAVRVGDTIAAGDELVIWTCFAFECSMRRQDVRMVGPTESHAYIFEEV